jgi:ubiquinone/menaquinone biosynthesis C-methylase UbiE
MKYSRIIRAVFYQQYYGRVEDLDRFQPIALSLEQIMSNSESVDLPYFDYVLADLPKADAALRGLLSRHAHWGYWENPETAEYTLAGFAAALEMLSRQVCDAAEISDGQRVLDCGCGFGGTVDHLNGRFQNLDLVGLNIDGRQLEIARANLQSQRGNQAVFVQGDACELPFEDASFDRVLAVECIFHFPSRERFFQEARRVLKPGGVLALCDFVPLKLMLILDKAIGRFVKPQVTEHMGSLDYSYTLKDYRQLAARSGFVPGIEQNMTQNTLPTCPVGSKVLNQDGGNWRSQSSLEIADRLLRLGLMRYMILSYRAI